MTTSENSEIKARLNGVHERIEIAASRTGRASSEITLVAVAKTVPVEVIEEAIELGVTNIGENRIQEASAKFDKIGKKVTWHMVGHLQSNKVKRALEIFDLIQSIDSLKLAEAVSERSVASGRVTDVLLEVNTSGEETKFGFEPDELVAGAEQIGALEGIRLKGLMTVGPLVERPEQARGAFVLLRELGQRVSSLGVLSTDKCALSMGMSGDFEIAIEEGSTMVRVGTAIFGERRG